LFLLNPFKWENCATPPRPYFGLPPKLPGPNVKMILLVQPGLLLLPRLVPEISQDFLYQCAFFNRSLTHVVVYVRYTNTGGKERKNDGLPTN
jgi:hypothetical protein